MFHILKGGFKYNVSRYLRTQKVKVLVLTKYII